MALFFSNLLACLQAAKTFCFSEGQSACDKQMSVDGLRPVFLFFKKNGLHSCRQGIN